MNAGPEWHLPDDSRRAAAKLAESGFKDDGSCDVAAIRSAVDQMLELLEDDPNAARLIGEIAYNLACGLSLAATDLATCDGYTPDRRLIVRGVVEIGPSGAWPGD